MDDLIVEFDLDDIDTIIKFHKFYEEVFKNNFKPNEIGSFEAYIQIKDNELKYKGIYEYHLSFIERDDEYIACFIYMYFPLLKQIAAEFACVKKEFRKQGLAKKLIDYAVLTKDFEYMFGEIESYNKTNLAIWKKYGFRHICIPYLQLSLGEGRQPVNDMFLCVYVLEPHLKSYTLIMAEDLRNFIYHYYKYSLFCEDPTLTVTYLYIMNLIKQFPYKYIAAVKLDDIQL